MLQFIRLAFPMICTLAGTSVNFSDGVGADPEAIRPVVVRSADYPTLQSALDAIPTAGGELRLSPGTIGSTSHCDSIEVMYG